ncbi:MAG TPA: hypothetical protein DDW17_06865 [Deltaproteobacteria bacterium]|nr:hypothetical protein [Deltaproteobacteria bacterium]
MQEEFIRRYGFIILLVAFLFQMLFGEGGIVSYVMLKRDISLIHATIKNLKIENSKLAEEIDRLQKDDRYLEEVVRQKYGFVREGERLYRIEK